jgi:20S proteasome subunit beta 3
MLMLSSNRLKHRVNLYQLREGRPISPKVLSNVICSVLYGKRFGPYFVEVCFANSVKNAVPFCPLDLSPTSFFALSD